MAEIKLTINGRVRNVNVSRLDWTKAQAINAQYGSTPTDYDNINSNFDCIMQTTLDSAAIPTGADDTMVIFRSTHASGALISDIIPPSEQLGTRVVYLGARQKTGDSLVDYYDLWSDVGADPAPTNTDLDLTDPAQLIYSNAALSGSGVFWQSNIWRTGADTSGYKVNANAQAYIRTDAGGTFGVSMCTGASGGNSVIVWSFGIFTYHDNSGSTGDRGNRWDAGFGWFPKYQGTGILRGTPTNGNEWNAAKNAAYIDGSKLDDCISAEIVYTEISGKPYLGCAACKWSGGYISEIDVALIPSWFWGDYETPDGETPDTKPNYYGFDVQPSGGNGTYHYTNVDISIPTAENPFSGILHDGHGVHIYSISSSVYDEVSGSLWGDGSLASALWKKWQNYKFNPIAAIVGCHKLPYQLNPRGTFTQVDCRASGCPLTRTTSAYYVNGKTTVDYSCGSVDLTEKYFGNFMDYEPYTTISMFLPFIGWQTIPTDRVMGGNLYLDYRCDIVTGNVVAYIRCVDENGHQSYTTTASGNAAMSFPVTGNDNGIGQVLGSVTAAAGVAIGAAAGMGAGAMIAGAAGAGLGAATARHTTQQSGQVSGNIGFINQLQPFIFVSMPVSAYSELWQRLHGLQSMLPVTVGTLAGTGHTTFSEIHADTIPCTSAEQTEIENILKSGVIL